jgi:hypothetical protein
MPDIFDDKTQWLKSIFSDLNLFLIKIFVSTSISKNQIDENSLNLYNAPESNFLNK